MPRLLQGVFVLPCADNNFIINHTNMWTLFEAKGDNEGYIWVEDVDFIQYI